MKPIVKARLLEFREVGPEVRHFVFDIPELERLDFTAGQFVSLSAHLHQKKVTRAYSLASRPDGNRFELCLNRVEEGLFSPYLFDLHPGDTVDMSGPYGMFVFRRAPSDSILVATGTGIAPFRGMLHAQLPSQPAQQITLIFGVRYECALLYRDEFEQMARQYSNFHFWPTLSRPEPGWRGRAGHVQQHVLEAIAERRDLDVYICGLNAMVNDVRGMLKQLGFERQRIVYERYD